MQHKVYPKFYAPFSRRELENGKRSKYIDSDLPRLELLPYMNHATNWVVSEKMDGTNTRIIWDGYKVDVMGRTASSQLQGYQNELLRTLNENDNYKFDETFGTQPVVIYGEAFGGKIQSNPHGVEPQFQVFDINIDGVWLEYDKVEEISVLLGLEMVPHSVVKGWDEVLGVFTDSFFNAQDAGKYFEGLVAVPAHMPLTRTGERVITKIKVVDFEELSEEYLSKEAKKDAE